MEIIIGKYSGFCMGVNHTVKKAMEEVQKNQTIYCLGEIVHNEQVIQNLENLGMITVHSLEEVPNQSKVIFRAHGEKKETYQEAKKKNLEIIDLTCGKILFIRKKIEEKRPDHYILIIGKKEHPETIGTISYAGEYSGIIENVEDIEPELLKAEKSSQNKIYIAVQTTFSTQKFQELIGKIKNKSTKEITVDNTICDATEKRQNETKQLAETVDKMIIIGGKNSSNTKELYNISKTIQKNSYIIQNKNDLEFKNFKKSDTIGIMAGASTPKETVEEVINALKKEIK